MNVLYSTGLVFRKFGGGERMVLLLAKELSKSGHKMYLQYENLPDSDGFLSELKAAGGEFVRINTRGNALKCFWNIYRFIRKHNIDIVHANFSPAKDLCVLAGRAAGVKKVICHFRNIETSKPRTGLKHWYKTHLSNVNVAISEAVKNDIIGYGAPPGSVKVIYNGVSVPTVAQSETRGRALIGAKETDLVVMCIAWQDSVKGVDLLLRSFAGEVAPVLETAGLWMIGAACEDLSYGRLSEELGITDRVKWLGVRNDVTDILPGCDLYVQPSRSEAFSRTVAEAMAAGRPVVAFNVGGIPEVVNDGVTGILVRPEDTRAMGEAIVGLLKDTEARDKMGAAGRARVRDMFSVEKEVKKITELYEGVG